MSSILHPVRSHSRQYAVVAAALAAIGVLVVLMASVLTGTTGASTGPSVQTPPQVHPGVLYHAPCFVHRPGQSVELGSRACGTAAP